MIKKSFDTKKYDFASGLKSIFSTENLSNISNNIDILERETDQSTKHRKLFY